jgi:hypothetical protein
MQEMRCHGWIQLILLVLTMQGMLQGKKDICTYSHRGNDDVRHTNVFSKSVQPVVSWWVLRVLKRALLARPRLDNTYIHGPIYLHCALKKGM